MLSRGRWAEKHNKDTAQWGMGHYYAVRSGLQWATCGFDYKSRGWINVDLAGNPHKDECARAPQPAPFRIMIHHHGRAEKPCNSLRCRV